MTVFKITSSPTMADLRTRFTKANQARIRAQRDEMDTLGRLHVQAIQRHAPKKTGEFARGITHKVTQSGDEVSFSVFTPQPLGKWLRPPGTKPHVIRARRAKYLRFFWPKAGRVMYVKSVNHPGYRPKSDFVKDAVDSLQNERRLGLRRITTRYIQEIMK